MGSAWGHPVAPSTPAQDYRLHVRAWQHYFAAIFGLKALGRVRGFSPAEMALPNHPDVCYEFVKTLRECGYRWVLVQEHTIEQTEDGGPIRQPHLPHRLVAVNSLGQTASIIAVIKTQGSDTKLVGQMQPYYEAKGLTRTSLAGKSVPPIVTQIADGEKISVEDAALAAIARAADGGMRDAESLLDRLLVTGATITAAMAEDALGLPPQDRLVAMGEALVNDDLTSLLEQAGQLYRAGYAPRTVAEQLTRSLRDALVAVLEAGEDAATGPDELGTRKSVLLRLIHTLDDEHDRFTRRNDLYSLEVALIKAGNSLRFPITGSADADVAAEQAPVERSHPREDARQGGSVPAPVPAAAAQTDTRPARASDADAERPTQRPDTRAAQREAPARDLAQPTEKQAAKQFSWHAIKAGAGPQLKAFLQPAHGSNDGAALRLEYEDRYKFHFEQLLKRRDELEDLIASLAGGGYTLEIVGPGRATGALPVGPEGGGSKKA
mgnify:CR=1 FL=1